LYLETREYTTQLAENTIQKRQRGSTVFAGDRHVNNTRHPRNRQPTDRPPSARPPPLHGEKTPERDLHASVEEKASLARDNHAPVTDDPDSRKQTAAEQEDAGEPIWTARVSRKPMEKRRSSIKS
jgi:hypothetical protein